MIDVLFENKDFLVINKQAGLVVHGDGKSTEKTLCDFLLEKYPDILDVGEPMTLQNGDIINRPGIVHRLDKETSGCLIVAKNQETFFFFKNQFQEHTIIKRYVAWVYGIVKHDDGEINAPIGRSTGDVRKWATGRGTRGTLRDAITDYKVLARYGKNKNQGSTEDGNYTYLEAYPKTGRTHQIRVHMRHLNHPIICDSLYAPNKEPALGFKRFALHAESITFEMPDGIKKTIHAPLPDDFIQAEELAKALV